MSAKCQKRTFAAVRFRDDGLCYLIPLTLLALPERSQLIGFLRSDEYQLTVERLQRLQFSVEAPLLVMEP